MQSIIKEQEIHRAVAATSAGTSAVTGSIIDTQGFDTAACVLILGDVTATSVITLKAYLGDESDLSDGAYSTTTATYTAAAADADNKILLLEIKKPQSRYVRFDVTRTTANAVIEAGVAVLGMAAAKVVTQPSVVIASGFAIDA